MRYDIWKAQVKFGLTLRAVRKALGLTQNEMADCFDVSRISYIHWERGEKMPRDMDLFCDSLRKLIKDRIGREEQDKSEGGRRS